MAAEPNISGFARLLYVLAGVAFASWGLWGADPGWIQWAWLALGSLLSIFGLIGYSPIHAILLKKAPKVS
jgi:hypothetical protein